MIIPRSDINGWVRLDLPGAVNEYLNFTTCVIVETEFNHEAVYTR